MSSGTNLGSFQWWVAALNLWQDFHRFFFSMRVQEASLTHFLTGREASAENGASGFTWLLTRDHRDGFESSQHSERAKSRKVSQVYKLRYVPEDFFVGRRKTSLCKWILLRHKQIATLSIFALDWNKKMLFSEQERDKGDEHNNKTPLCLE